MNLHSANILITGGTGSFGNRVVKHLVSHGAKNIRVFSRDEKKQWEMKQLFPSVDYWIGDIRDRERTQQAMRGIDYVFHAAALKHVPACESYPMEAVKTNVLGTYNVCEAAKHERVKMVVSLSTDKAVKPVNAMGISKAMAEKIVCNENASFSSTVFCCVRYGNVIGSRGSVVPLFMKLIQQNVPITITVPEMTRFLLTLDDAVDLVFYAFKYAVGGEIFVRKSPACTVQLLAETMRNKYSVQRENHPIIVTGVRPGEKIHEVLVNEYEIQRVRSEDNFFIIGAERNATTQTDVIEEYTSANTKQLVTEQEVSNFLDTMGPIDV